MEGIPLHWSGHWYAEQERRLESLSKSKKKKRSNKRKRPEEKRNEEQAFKKKGLENERKYRVGIAFFLPSFTGFDRVVFADAFSWNFTGFYCFFLCDLSEFCWGWLRRSRFDRVISSNSRFYWVLLGFQWISRSLIDFMHLYLFMRGFLELVLISTIFYLVLLKFIAS